MIERKQRRRALLATTLLCCTPFGAAMAQDAPATQTADVVDDNNVITVTGSRLARTDLTATSPITIVGEEDIKLSGNATLESTLLESPQLASSNTSSVNNGGGSGVLTANLRGLGPSRTLVLTNGRRFIPANSDGQVDLASIPDALIERTEIITGGASAVYGSDAIAGAVNFILKRSFTGMELSYNYGQTFEGDGQTHKIDATFGSDFGDGRGNVVLSASYTTRDPVFQADRDFAQVPLDTVNGKLVPGGSGNVPGTRIGLTSAQLNGLVGVSQPTGACSSRTSVQFRDNGQPFIYCTPENAYNYAPFNYLLRPMERIQGSALAHYEITDNVEAFADIFVINTRNRFRQAPDSFTPITPGAGSQTLLVPSYATNPALFPLVRQFFIDNKNIFDPNNTGTARVVGGARRSEELGPRENMFERNSFNITGGLRGHFGDGDKAWHWEAFYQLQRSRTDNRTEGMISQSRLSQSLDAVLSGGQVVCRDTSRGCVAASIFGFNSITPAAASFLTPPRVSNDIFTRQVAGASLSGTLFSLPRGPVAVAVGTEYRKDRYEFFASPQDLANEYGPTSQKNLSGSFDVKEVFGELRVPILSDTPFFQTLAVEGAVRYSDYGGDNAKVGGVTTWKVGGEYAPVKWIRFRAAYNRAIRAPTLNELKAPITEGFSSATDPCAASGKSAAVRALCIAQGVPAADVDTFVQAALGATGRSGGNPNLHEERSKTLTVGGVISPPFLDRLNLTVDYFRVRVDGAVASINVNQTLTDCFTNLDINSVTCKNITRLPNGQLDVISTQSSNIGALQVEGIDAQLDYTIPLGGFLAIGGGRSSLKLQGVASWLFERSSQVISTLAPVDCAGRFGNGCIGTGAFGLPDFKLNLSSTFNSGPLTLRAQGRMIGKFELYPGATAAVTSAPVEWYFDLAATVRPFDHVELFGGNDNLFDNKPPILGTALAGDANTDPSLWDVIGRRFFVGARLRF
jgi:outer membrane receptor protein involved in Fe transport